MPSCGGCMKPPRPDQGARVVRRGQRPLVAVALAPNEWDARILKVPCPVGDSDTVQVARRWCTLRFQP